MTIDQRPRIWWRSTAAVADSRADDPDLSGFSRTSDWEGYIPFECCVYPERVLEYPDGDELYQLAGPAEARRIARLIENMDVGSAADLEERFASKPGPSDPQSLAFYELGRCPGSRVGGKPSGVNAGRQFDHLVTLSTWEFDAASFRRWLAVEDQRLLAPPRQAAYVGALKGSCCVCFSSRSARHATRPDPTGTRVYLPRPRTVGRCCLCQRLKCRLSHSSRLGTKHHEILEARLSR